jgi:hypothetical protein
VTASSAVSAGDTILATHYNNLRTDVLDQHGARVYHNAVQAVANTTDVVAALNTERYDNDTFHDTSTNNSRLTGGQIGKYAIFANCLFEANATGIRSLEILLNGSIVIAKDVQEATSANQQPYLSISTVYIFTATTDYVEMRVWQNSGGSLNLLAATVTAYTNCEFSIVRLTTA